jgi:hypothetical protein
VEDDNDVEYVLIRNAHLPNEWQSDFDDCDEHFSLIDALLDFLLHSAHKKFFEIVGIEYSNC